MSRLLMLDLTGPDSLDLVHSAVARGHQVFAVCDVADNALAGEISLDGVELIAFAEPDAVGQIVRYATGVGVHGVTTANEFLTPVVTEVCELLGLPGNDPSTARAPRNKVEMTARMAQAGVRVPVTVTAGNGDDVRAAVRDGALHYPLVVKPAENAGSRGVTIVATPDLLPAAVARVTSQPNPFGISLDRRIIVQEYIEGPEFSVESVTQDGRVRHMSVTRKFCTDGLFRVEYGHSTPARLAPPIERALLDQVSRALTALGIRNGVSHTEAILRPDGAWVLLEVAARIGAGRIALLVEAALGVSLAAASVDLALGVPVAVGATRRAAAASRLLMAPRAGRLVAVNHLPVVGGNVLSASLMRQPGTVVSGPEDNRCRVGTIVVSGVDEEAANRRAEELLAGVQVLVEPVPDESATRPAA